ncbi:MAG: DNA polymerase III subunit delta [Endomicrobium sp.]|jgi:DNA polymerase-3 subunit delta|nr:DNA polymerase III subunit delta [Endomicrobium sp.]
MPLLKVQDFINNKLISDEKLSPVYLFIGEESYFVDLCLKKIEKFRVVSDLDREVFYASETCVEDILNSLRTLPFLDDKRMIIVKAVNKIRAIDAEKLANYLQNVVETSCLVLLYLDNLKKETITKRKEFVNKCINSKNCVSVDCRKRYKSEIKEFVKKEFALKGKTILDSVILRIINENDTSLLNISNEVEKLSLFVGKNRKDVTQDDLERMRGYTTEESTYALSLNLESKNLKKSLLVLEKLISVGEELLLLLSVISSFVRRMLNAKSMFEEQGISSTEIAFRLGISKFYTKDFFLNLKKHDVKSLKKCLRTILEADTAIKTGGSYAAISILEKTILLICK